MISDCSSITRPNALAVSNLCRAKHHVTPFQTYSYQKSYEKLIAKKTNRIFFPIEYKEKLNYSMEQRKIIKFRKSIKPSIFTPWINSLAIKFISPVKMNFRQAARSLRIVKEVCLPPAAVKSLNKRRSTKSIFQKDSLKPKKKKERKSHTIKTS